MDSAFRPNGERFKCALHRLLTAICDVRGIRSISLQAVPITLTQVAHTESDPLEVAAVSSTKQELHYEQD